MKEIDILIQMQEIDSQVYKLKTLLKEHPEKIVALEGEFNEATATLKEFEGQKKQMQLEHKDKELELQTKEQTVAKQKTQLFNIKTNKEYNALQLEIEKLKADNSLLEEQILTILEKIDNLQAEIESEKADVSAKESVYKKEKQVLENEMKDIQQQVDSFGLKRKDISSGDLKPDILDRYNRIIEHLGELAVVSVKNEACQGCFRTVRAQVLSELKLGKLLTCENCTRIIYVDPADS